MKNVEKNNETTINEEKSNKKNKFLSQLNMSKILGSACAFLVLFMFGYSNIKIIHLQNRLTEQTQQLEQARKVYVYDLENVLKGLNVLEIKRKFEDEIIKLNDEVFAAEEKIKSLKNAKVKEDFSTMYLNNIRMKRDDLLANYDKTIKELTDKINKVVGEIAKEQNVSVIFMKNAIAVKTPYVVDITEEIISRVRNK